MRKDSIQPRKRKQPAQGRKRRNKTPTKSGKEQNDSKAASTVSLPLRPVPTKEPTIVNNSFGFSSKQSFPIDNPHLGSPNKKDCAKTKEGKVFITDAEAQHGIAPLEISRGMRSYSCMSEECKNLHFTSLEGPDSIKEHIAKYHRERI